MRDINRIDPILEAIRKIWKKCNKTVDLRLGQLFLNVLRDPALYYIEDEDLIKVLEEFYKNWHD